MKRNDIKALHEKSLEELNKLNQELLAKLAKMRLEKSARRLENTSSVKILADDIARVKTIITQKQLANKEAKPAKEAKTTEETK